MRRVIHTVANTIHKLEYARVDSLLFERYRVGQDDHGHVGHASGSHTLKCSSEKKDRPDWRGSTEYAADYQGDNGDLQREMPPEDVRELTEDGDESGGCQREGRDDPVQLIESVCEKVNAGRWGRVRHMYAKVN